MKIEREVICPSQLTRVGASPWWCSGNTTIVRVGDRVFATAMLDVTEMAPYNCHLLCIYEKRGDSPWERVFCDDQVWQREPCPLMYLGDNRLAVTINPSVRKYPPGEENKGVPCIPMLYIFDISGEVQLVDTICLQFETPSFMFSDHSYRSCARDTENGNLIFSNQYRDYSSFYAREKGMMYSYKRGIFARHCYTVLDKNLRIIRHAKLESKERVCYQTIAMRNGETYLLGRSDEHETNEEYRNYMREVLGYDFDYDMSILELYYSPDIATENLKYAGTVSNKRDTRGWVEALDCCYDTNGDILFLVSEQNVYHTFMHDKFFPDVPLDTVLKVCRYSHAECVEEIIIDRYTEENEIKVVYGGYFHTAADGKIYLIWTKENSVADKPGMYRDGFLPPVTNTATYLSKLEALDCPPIKIFDVSGKIFGNKTREGALPGNIIDVISYREDEAVYYSRCDLKEVLAAK